MATVAAKGFYMLPMWLWEMTRADRSVTMRDAADLFMLMMHRTKLSQKNGFVDKDKHIYIHFTYAEIQEMFKCGKTKVWQMYKLLKDKGLVTVKYQGFGYPMMVYVHAAAITNTETKNTEKEIKMHDASEMHTKLCNGSFTEEQIAQIVNIVDEIAPKESNEDKYNFIESMYEKLLKTEKRKDITNRFGYFIKMLKNATFKKTKPKKTLCSNSPPKREPSFDLAAILDHAKNSTPEV